MTLGLWTVVALFAAAAALRFAMSGESIDAEHLYAALSAYMLAGIFFGLFYWVIEQIGPGSFSAGAEFSRMGGNPAEDHPISMNWLARAKEQGTYILHVDPRFNRTSSIADVFAKLRSGTDIAFVGGMCSDHRRHITPPIERRRDRPARAALGNLRAVNR